MTDSPLRRKDLEIVTALERLIPKEVNLIEIFLLQEPETVSLIPARREEIEGDLTPDAVGEIEIGKFLFHRDHHIRAYTALEVDLFVVVAFLP